MNFETASAVADAVAINTIAVPAPLSPVGADLSISGTAVEDTDDEEVAVVM